MDYKLWLLKHRHEYMKLVQHNNISTVNDLVSNDIVSPSKFINDDFMPPLSLACEIGNLEMAKLLISLGAELDPKKKTLIPPLHAAIRGGSLNCTKLLMQHGANIKSKYGSYYKKTAYIKKAEPLALALFLGHNAIARELILNNASMKQVIEVKISSHFSTKKETTALAATDFLIKKVAS